MISRKKIMSFVLTSIAAMAVTNVSAFAAESFASRTSDDSEAVTAVIDLSGYDLTDAAYLKVWTDSNTIDYTITGTFYQPDEEGDMLDFTIYDAYMSPYPHYLFGINSGLTKIELSIDSVGNQADFKLPYGYVDILGVEIYNFDEDKIVSIFAQDEPLVFYDYCNYKVNEGVINVPNGYQIDYWIAAMNADSYTWQVSDDGEKWTDLEDIETQGTDSLNATIDSRLSDKYIRCKCANKKTEVYSDVIYINGFDVKSIEVNKEAPKPLYHMRDYYYEDVYNTEGYLYLIDTEGNIYDGDFAIDWLSINPVPFAGKVETDICGIPVVIEYDTEYRMDRGRNDFETKDIIDFTGKELTTIGQTSGIYRYVPEESGEYTIAVLTDCDTNCVVFDSNCNELRRSGRGNSYFSVHTVDNYYIAGETYFIAIGIENETECASYMYVSDPGIYYGYDYWPRSIGYYGGDLTLENYEEHKNTVWYAVNITDDIINGDLVHIESSEKLKGYEGSSITIDNPEATEYVCVSFDENEVVFYYYDVFYHDPDRELPRRTVYDYETVLIGDSYTVFYSNDGGNNITYQLYEQNRSTGNWDYLCDYTGTEFTINDIKEDKPYAIKVTNGINHRLDFVYIMATSIGVNNYPSSNIFVNYGDSIELSVDAYSLYDGDLTYKWVYVTLENGEIIVGDGSSVEVTIDGDLKVFYYYGCYVSDGVTERYVPFTVQLKGESSVSHMRFSETGLWGQYDRSDVDTQLNYAFLDYDGNMEDVSFQWYVCPVNAFGEIDVREFPVKLEGLNSIELWLSDIDYKSGYYILEATDGNLTASMTYTLYNYSLGLDGGFTSEAYLDQDGTLIIGAEDGDFYSSYSDKITYSWYKLVDEDYVLLEDEHDKTMEVGFKDVGVYKFVAYDGNDYKTYEAYVYAPLLEEFNTIELNRGDNYRLEGGLNIDYITKYVWSVGRLGYDEGPSYYWELIGEEESFLDITANGSEIYCCDSYIGDICVGHSCFEININGLMTIVEYNDQYNNGDRLYFKVISEIGADIEYHWRGVNYDGSVVELGSETGSSYNVPYDSEYDYYICYVLCDGLGTSFVFRQMDPDYYGWYYSDGKSYHYSNGVKDYGWLYSDWYWYYLDADDDGARATGWKFIDNNWYYFNEYGEMLTGWLEFEGNWYYLKSSGAMATGWACIDYQWYYFRPSGIMATGWVKSAGKWYYLRKSGIMARGWTYIDNNWYYMRDDGSMLTGWFGEYGNRYYMLNTGEMVYSCIMQIGEWYYEFNRNGVCIG